MDKWTDGQMNGQVNGQVGRSGPATRFSYHRNFSVSSQGQDQDQDTAMEKGQEYIPTPVTVKVMGMACCQALGQDQG